jgi:DNA-directed RNA polymerase subunit RPC12/RpoP
MAIEYVCADCGARTELPDELAGHRTRCRKCNAPGLVPTPPRPERPAPAAPAPRARVPDVVRGALWALCVVWVALVALAYLNGGSAADVVCRVLIVWAACFAADAALRALAAARRGP